MFGFGLGNNRFFGVAATRRAKRVLPLFLIAILLPTAGCAVRVLGPDAGTTLSPAQQELRLAAAELAETPWPKAEPKLSVRSVVGILVNGAPEPADAEAEGAAASAPVDLWIKQAAEAFERREEQLAALMSDMRMKIAAADQLLGALSVLAPALETPVAAEERNIAREAAEAADRLARVFADLLTRLPGAYPEADAASFAEAQTAFDDRSQRIAALVSRVASLPQS